MSNLKQIQFHSGQGKRVNPLAENGPITSQILAIVTLLPLGGTLLGLAAITFIATIIGLAITTPLYILFSPVIVSAAIIIALAVAGFLVAGAFGLSGLSAISWVLCMLGQAIKSMPEHLDTAMNQAQGLANYAGQKTKEAGQTIQCMTQDSGSETTKATIM